MPIYEFRCTACGHEFEALVFRSDVTEPCPNCGCEQVTRLLSRFASKSGDRFVSSVGPSDCSGCTSKNCSSCG